MQLPHRLPHSGGSCLGVALKLEPCLLCSVRNLASQVLHQQLQYFCLLMRLSMQHLCVPLMFMTQFVPAGSLKTAPADILMLYVAGCNAPPCAYLDLNPPDEAGVVSSLAVDLRTSWVAGGLPLPCKVFLRLHVVDRKRCSSNHPSICQVLALATATCYQHSLPM